MSITVVAMDDRATITVLDLRHIDVAEIEVILWSQRRHVAEPLDITIATGVDLPVFDGWPCCAADRWARQRQI